MERIQVTMTEVWTYSPDYDNEYYTEHDCKDIKTAMELDKADLEAGEVSLGELANDVPETTYEWKILDED